MNASPSLRWKEDHEHVTQKMKRYIANLMEVDRKLPQLCLYCNTYMLTNDFFRCGILQFTKKRCEELNKIYELPIMRKMGLGDYFLIKLLHIKNQR